MNLIILSISDLVLRNGLEKIATILWMMFVDVFLEHLLVYQIG